MQREAQINNGIILAYCMIYKIEIVSYSFVQLSIKGGNSVYINDFLQGFNRDFVSYLSMYYAFKLLHISERRVSRIINYLFHPLHVLKANLYTQ